MKRDDVTKILSELVRKKLSTSSTFCAEEVELDFGKARVDFVRFKPFNILQNGMGPVALIKVHLVSTRLNLV